MGLQTGRSANTYTEVNAPLEITLNNATYTEILPANPERVGYKVTQVKKNILIKEMEAGTPDSLDRGFELRAKSNYESKADNVPIGAISAKSLNGNTTILVVEE